MCSSDLQEERMNDNMQAPSETELTDSLNETMLASEPKCVHSTQDAVTTHASDHAQSAQSQTLGQKTRKSLFPEFSPEFGKIPSAVKIFRQGPTNSDQVRSSPTYSAQVGEGPTDSDALHTVPIDSDQIGRAHV